VRFNRGFTALSLSGFPEGRAVIKLKKGEWSFEIDIQELHLSQASLSFTFSQFKSLANSRAAASFPTPSGP
jgi:hypothetical protein